MTAGYVYCVVHEQHPEWIKIGLTKVEPAKRLAQYQTADPHRAYEMPFVLPVDDCRAVEREVHAAFADAGFQLKNEWVQTKLALAQSIISTTANDFH